MTPVPSSTQNEPLPGERRPGRSRILSALKAWLAHLNGDEAYARYLAHWQHAHGGAGKPLSRAQFFREETARRWNGVRRCC